jgi:predicted peptidase
MKYLFINFCFLFSQLNFSQEKDSLSVSEKWLKTITSNAIEKSNKKDDFKKATEGYAIYFAKVDTLQVPFLVYVPKNYNPKKKYPVVVYLHGGVVSLENFEYKDPEFADEPIFSIADKFNVIVVFPYGKKDFGWVKQEKAFENIITIINQTSEIYNIKKDKIYIGGMSNGGTATFWFTTNKSSLFAGFYSFSAFPKLNFSDINFKNITKDRPFFSINAEDDKLYSFDKIKAIHNEHLNETKYWFLDSVSKGNHGFIYGDNGKQIIHNLFEKLLKQRRNFILPRF